MVELALGHPEYGWEINKGYATPEHLAALRRHGPTDQHRCSWRLPRQLFDDGPDEALVELSEVGGEWLPGGDLAQVMALVGENDAELAAVEDTA